MRSVHAVLPGGVDDPRRPSGGNTYDRRVLDALGVAGWTVTEHPVAGAWPAPGVEDLAVLGAVLAGLPDGGLVLIDGLVASAAPDVVVPAAARLRVVVLMHMPLGHVPPAGGERAARRAERAVLEAATTVITTSEWTRARIGELYGVPRARVHVAAPGVEAAPAAPGSGGGGELLCVAAVIPGKGHDRLLDALGAVADLDWRCRCVGTLERDPAFAAGLRERALIAGLSDRFMLTGPRVGDALGQAYAAADVLVLASRAETYGMVVTEALARALPVIATAVGGVPEALGHGTGGVRPGLLVPADAPDRVTAALGTALRAWLSDGALRGRLRVAAGERRAALRGWKDTAAAVAGALDASL